MSDVCVICAGDPANPVICDRCAETVRRNLDTVGRYRRMLHDWTEIDPGTPGKDEPHMLALVDNPLLTTRGLPDLTVIAMTDLRTKRIPSDDGGWDPDDVLNVDADLLVQARWIIDERGIDPQLRDVFDVLRLIRLHLDWAMRHPGVDEFAAAIHGCAIALRSAARAWPDPAIGACPAAHPERDTCGGPLVFDYRGPLPLDPSAHGTPTHLVCKGCGDETLVDAYVWQMMRALPEHARIPVPREWVCQTWQITPGQLRNWVYRGQVRCDSDGRVDLVDVLTRLNDTPSERAGA